MRALYLGTDPSRYTYNGHLVHYPIIRTILRISLDETLIAEIDKCTHYLFTSPNAVIHWFSIAPHKFDNSLKYYAVGASTSETLLKRAIQAIVAPVATQEGVIKLLENEDLSHAIICWPRSSKARTVLSEYLLKRGVTFLGINLYETVSQKLEPIPDLGSFDELIFTSPSTVDAFIEIFGNIPWTKKITPIGPITANRLRQEVKNN